MCRAGNQLFEGKLVDVQRELSTGFVRGRAKFEGLGSNKGQIFEMDFQNENLIGFIDGEPKTMVPDLITVLDYESGSPITTESLRYGQRVCVVAVRVPEIMRTDAALAQFGPSAFGIKEKYRPLAPQ